MLADPAISVFTQKTKYLFDIPLYICYVIVLKKTQKTEQLADTIDRQNRKCYTSLGNFFPQPEI